MTIDFSNNTLNLILWLIVALVLLTGIAIVVRFFFHHILKHLVQGCLVLLAIAAILAVLHYFRVF